MKEKKMKELKQKLTKDPKGVESLIMYYISLPQKTHTMGIQLVVE